MIQQITEAEDIQDLEKNIQEEANLLMISGCFHHVKSLEEKYHIAEDLKRWYAFGRTRAAFER